MEETTTHSYFQNTTSGKIPKNTAETGPLGYEIEALKEAEGISKPGNWCRHSQQRDDIESLKYVS